MHMWWLVTYVWLASVFSLYLFCWHFVFWAKVWICFYSHPSSWFGSCFSWHWPCIFLYLLCFSLVTNNWLIEVQNTSKNRIEKIKMVIMWIEKNRSQNPESFQAYGLQSCQRMGVRVGKVHVTRQTCQRLFKVVLCQSLQQPSSRNERRASHTKNKRR